MEKARNLQLEEHYHRFSLVVILLLTIGLAIAVAVYFVHRMDYVLEHNGILLSDADYSDLVHLQIQFVIGILSMTALVIIFLIFNRRYATYLNYEAKMDALTGLLTRKAFFQSCAKLLQVNCSAEHEWGYFIMTDIDYFKEANDRYGHPEGDRILRETARALRMAFDGEGIAGRVGSDEFAALLPAVSQERLEGKLQLFLDQVRAIGRGDHRVSCSVGIVTVQGDESVDCLYQKADRMLYRAKQQGRDQYVLDAAWEQAVSKGCSR